MLSCLLNGQYINCFDGKYNKEQLKKWSTRKILLCPACGKPYEYCHGKVMNPYFRHMDKLECVDKYTEPETEEHKQGKIDLFKWISVQPGVTDCVLEGWLPGTKQRPDIMFKYNGQLCVIEYQCSPIATEYYERHELYTAAGIKDIWICGTQNYFQFYHEGSGSKKVCEIEKESCIYYDVKSKCIYKVFPKMSIQLLNNFINNKNDKNYLMRNIFDHRVNKINFCFIKNKHEKSNTIATCKKLSNLRLKNIK